LPARSITTLLTVFPVGARKTQAAPSLAFTDLLGVGAARTSRPMAVPQVVASAFTT
jgi:hypothetical protein